MSIQYEQQNNWNQMSGFVIEIGNLEYESLYLVWVTHDNYEDLVPYLHICGCEQPALVYHQEQE